MKKYVTLFVVLFILSLGANIYVYAQKENAEEQVLKGQVVSLRIITQNTIKALDEDNKVMLEQTLANLQSTRPFHNDDDRNTEEVMAKYDTYIKTSVANEPPAGVREKLSKAFKLIVPLQESNNLKEDQVHAAMKKINKTFGE